MESTGIHCRMAFRTDKESGRLVKMFRPAGSIDPSIPSILCVPISCKTGDGTGWLFQYSRMALGGSGSQLRELRGGMEGAILVCESCIVKLWLYTSRHFWGAQNPPKWSHSDKIRAPDSTTLVDLWVTYYHSIPELYGIIN